MEETIYKAQVGHFYAPSNVHVLELPYPPYPCWWIQHSSVCVPMLLSGRLQMYCVVRSYGCFHGLVIFRNRVRIDLFEPSEQDAFFAIL